MTRSLRQRQYVVAVPAAAAISVLLLGPGVLIGMWLLMPWPTNVLTWPYHRSYSLGDTLLLPLLTAALLVLGRGQRGQGASRPSRLPMLFATVIAVAVSGWVQYRWWSDPTPPPTWWTAGRPHHFTVAGAWHAAFFVAMSAVLAYLFVNMLMTWKTLRRTDPAELDRRLKHPAFPMLLCCGLTFAALVTMDSIPTVTTTSSHSTVITMAGSIAFTLTVLVFAARSHLIRRAFAIALSLITTVTIAAVCRSWPPSVWGWLTIIAVMSVASAIFALASGRSRR